MLDAWQSPMVCLGPRADEGLVITKPSSGGYVKSLSGPEAEGTREVIDYIFLAGAGMSGFLGILHSGSDTAKMIAYADLAIAFAVGLIVFEISIYALATYWFGDK